MENFTDPAAPSPAPPASSPPGVASRLRDAVRIAFFLRVPEQRLRPGALEVAAAILLTLCVPTLYNAAVFGADGHLGVWEASQALFHIPMILIAASIAARLAQRDDAIATLLFATLIAWFVVDVATWVAWMGVESANPDGKRAVAPTVFYYAPVAWLSLAGARFAMALEAQSPSAAFG